MAGRPGQLYYRHRLQCGLETAANKVQEAVARGPTSDRKGTLSVSLYHSYWLPFSSHGAGKPLPKQVSDIPRLLQGDGKMSKSKGNVMYADDLVNFFRRRCRPLFRAS